MKAVIRLNDIGEYYVGYNPNGDIVHPFLKGTRDEAKRFDSFEAAIKEVHCASFAFRVRDYNKYINNSPIPFKIVIERF